MLNKCGFLSVILFIISCSEIKSQIWSRQDSIRLANILSGKDSLRLNPEFQNAIRNGTLINTDPVGKMRISKSKMPITKDFSEYIKIDRKALSEVPYITNGKSGINTLPPQAAMRTPAPNIKSDEMRINPKAFAINPQIIKEAMAKTPLATFDANHLLSYLLSPSYRQKFKNSQRNTHKTYNKYPTPDILAKQKAFRKAHPELVLMPDSVHTIKPE